MISGISGLIYVNLVKKQTDLIQKVINISNVSYNAKCKDWFEGIQTNIEGILRIA